MKIKEEMEKARVAKLEEKRVAALEAENLIA
jgi:hypothetical protein